jgi:hypothetical protein
MPSWPALPLAEWRATCDTLHAHAQVIGKIATKLAPQEPQWQHAALRLTARGWETAPLPAPGGSGSLVVTLDLPAREVVVEYSAGARTRIALTPHRSVADVTRDVLNAVPVDVDLKPQEVSWTTPFDEDEEHRTFEPAHIDSYFAAATSAAQVLAALRAPYRGRSTPVNAWWGSFDLAVSLFSGRPAEPPSSDLLMRNAMDSEEIAVGWWPGDDRYPRAAFYAYAHPSPSGFTEGTFGRWDDTLGEFILDWDDVIAAEAPFETALEFARGAARHGCSTCGWEPGLAASLHADPPPIA